MSELAEIRRQLFDISLELGAIRLDMNFPFRWASGYMMPIYNDSRLLLSRPKARGLIAEGLELLLRQNGHQQVENIAGVATGGIAHALLLAERMQLPMQYVRSETKMHGLSHKIEGLPGSCGEAGYKGQSAVVIEDVISTGESALRAVETVRQAGAEVKGCFVIYSYAFSKAEEAFTKAGLTCRAILSFPELLGHVEQQNLFRQEDVEQLRHWHRQPFMYLAE
ncbi:orotate phosphoribosyltransferase [Candidatus Haliotispira prima]|uniref:Orotate phosphoribosyltransferase n=1 Tax=Candidatus Haliotispira prima TaxID=3034016 RepID=A0ABY8MIF3_9SPIO|nr:orotate phosphoribosyltransferase [Candidatus Haliotispira prima]